MASLGIYETDNNGHDIPTSFTHQIGDNVLTCYRTDPHGFWRFKFKRGAIPPILQGDFSGEPKARVQLQMYLAQRDLVKEKATA